jgi:hypothetical protein
MERTKSPTLCWRSTNKGSFSTDVFLFCLFSMIKFLRRFFFRNRLRTSWLNAMDRRWSAGNIFEKHWFIVFHDASRLCILVRQWRRLNSTMVSSVLTLTKEIPGIQARQRRVNTLYSGRKITESLGNVSVRGTKSGKSKGERNVQQSVWACIIELKTFTTQLVMWGGKFSIDNFPVRKIFRFLKSSLNISFFLTPVDMSHAHDTA